MTYQNRRFNRVAVDSADAFQQVENGKDVEGGYKDAMRLARLEQEELRVKKAIEEKQRKEREEDKMKMDLDRTPPAAEIEAAEKVLASMNSTTRRKRRWDVEEPSDENVDPNNRDKGEWLKEATEASAPKKHRSRWDATPANVVGETPKRSRWDQTPVASTVDLPMTPIIMNALGIMQDDKQNRFLSDEELEL